MSEHGSTTDTIEQIGKGASYVVMLARVRMGEAMEAFDNGDFPMAMQRLDEARAKIGPLMNAQQYLGSFTDEIRVVRAKDLEQHVGHELYGISTIENVEVHDHGDHCCYTITCEGQEEPFHYRDEQELLVALPQPE